MGLTRPGALRGLRLPGSRRGGEVAGSVSLARFLVPTLFSRSWGPPGALITLGRCYRPGAPSCPAAGWLHAGGWQPASFDKLIRPNLSPAARHRPPPQISLLPRSCSTPSPADHRNPGLCLAPAGAPGRLDASPLPRPAGKSWVSGAELHAQHPSRCSQAGGPTLGLPPLPPRRRQGL